MDGAQHRGAAETLPPPLAEYPAAGNQPRVRGRSSPGETDLDKVARLCQTWHTMSKGKTPKPLFWIGASKKDLKNFPGPVQDACGFALWLAQIGQKHLDAKPLKGFKGAGVLEIVEDFEG